MFAIALAITSGALAVLHAVVAHAPPPGRTRRAGAGQPGGHRRAIRPPARLGVSPPPDPLTPPTDQRNSLMTITADVHTARPRRLPTTPRRQPQPRWVRPGAAGAAGRHRGAVPVGAGLIGLGQQLLRRRGAGRHAGLEGLAVRIAGRGQRDHRRQAARRNVGDGVVRQAVRLQRVHDAAAAGVDGRGAVARAVLRPCAGAADPRRA